MYNNEARSPGLGQAHLGKIGPPLRPAVPSPDFSDGAMPFSHSTSISVGGGVGEV